jgi:tRNA A-37 threonylcarbamoyl transferase component Bud32
LILLMLTIVGVTYRQALTDFVERRFFRTAYNEEKVLLTHIERLPTLDSVEEISQLLSEDVTTYLQVSWVRVFFRQQRHSELIEVHSSRLSNAKSSLPQDGSFVRHMERQLSAEEWDQLVEDCPEAESFWTDRFGDEAPAIVVPVLGGERRMIGLVALGEKKSSEPFTARDRKLLEALATQIGIAYENILLRQGIQDRARAEEAIRVRLGEAKLNLVRECPRCGACFDSDVDVCENDGAKLEFVEPVERVIDGKYRLDSVIGRGGMGSVYRAYHQRLNRMVAVKVLGNRSLNDATALRRFAREAQASARIDHPNVVRVYESGELAAGGAYLVMELIHGYSWRKLLRDRKVLSGPEAAVLVEQLLDGVEAAHQAHVLHRDLKPENVMISEQGNVVKVADFGLAKIRVDGLNDPKSQTRMGIAMGTLGYMSREQMLGRQVDERTDIYSIGMIVLETLTGPLPPSKLEVTNPASELLPQRLEHPQATPAQLRLSFILSKCLDLRPDSRYPSIARLRKDLLDTLRACPTDPQVPVVEETVSLDGTVVNRPTMSFPPEED